MLWQKEFMDIAIMKAVEYLKEDPFIDGLRHLQTVKAVTMKQQIHSAFSNYIRDGIKYLVHSGRKEKSNYHLR